MGRTRLNKMGHLSSYARLSTLGTTRIDYCEPEEYASTTLTNPPPGLASPWSARRLASPVSPPTTLDLGPIASCYTA